MAETYTAPGHSCLEQSTSFRGGLEKEHRVGIDIRRISSQAGVINYFSGSKF